MNVCNSDLYKNKGKSKVIKKIYNLKMYEAQGTIKNVTITKTEL